MNDTTQSAPVEWQGVTLTAGSGTAVEVRPGWSRGCAWCAEGFPLIGGNHRTALGEVPCLGVLL